MHFIAIIGSCNKNSFTEMLTKSILLKLCKEHDDYSYEIITLNEYNLLYCCGCKICFKKGCCPFDYKDNFIFIKSKMKNADCLIFASPVYAHNITGIMKTFIDRMTLSLHLMNYAGCFGITLATTERNGQETVIEYLKKMQNHMGIKNIGNLSCVRNSFNPKEFIEESVRDIEMFINNNYSFSSVELEDYYLHLRELYKRITKDGQKLTYEMKYWLKSKAKGAYSFQEFAINNKEERIGEGNK